MIAVDTNLLIYAHRAESPWHTAAKARLLELAEGSAPWTIFWPCVHEFFGIVTHPRIYEIPTPTDTALAQIETWLDSPNHIHVAEAEGYWSWLKITVQEGQIAGPRIHDAKLAALCRQHGVREFWTADRDFSRFPGLPVRNPLVS